LPTCSYQIPVEEEVWPTPEVYEQWRSEGVWEEKSKRILPQGISRKVYFSFKSYFCDSISITVNDSLLYSGWIRTGPVTGFTEHPPIVLNRGSGEFHAKIKFVMHESGACFTKHICLTFWKIMLFNSKAEGITLVYTNEI
jgi:hypothetical protein